MVFSRGDIYFTEKDLKRNHQRRFYKLIAHKNFMKYLDSRFSEEDLDNWMRRCIELGKMCPPEMKMPHTGAIVIDKNGKIIGEGHRDFASPTHITVHAERKAIDSAFLDLESECILVSTLEPCIPNRKRDHQLFPSCCEYIVDKNIKTVIVGCRDNSPVVGSGDGVDYLQDRGINVIMYKKFEKEIRELRGYQGYVTQ